MEFFTKVKFKVMSIVLKMKSMFSYAETSEDTVAASSEPEANFTDSTGKIPFEIMEKIFEHLPSADLRNCAMVNHEWRQIGTSSKFMRNFKLAIKKVWEHMTLQEASKIVESREYTRVRIDKCSAMSNFLPMLLSSGHKWKVVSINFVEFKTLSSFVDLMAVIEDSVEKLELFGIVIKKYDAVERVLKFPSLKSLTFSKSDIMLFDIFHHCTVLKSLEMYAPKGEHHGDGEIHDVFVSMDNFKTLRRLHFDRQWLDEIFVQPIEMSNFPLRIEDLSITNYNSVYSGLVHPNFVRFLQTQSSSIQKLHFGDNLGLNYTSVRIAYSMQSLKYLKSLRTPDPNILEFRLPINTSIEVLHMNAYNFFDSSEDHIIEFLRASPNLKRLYLRSITRRIGGFISQNLHLLHRLAVWRGFELAEIVKQTMPSFELTRNPCHYDIIRKF